MQVLLMNSFIIISSFCYGIVYYYGGYYKINLWYYGWKFYTIASTVTDCVVILWLCVLFAMTLSQCNTSSWDILYKIYNLVYLQESCSFSLVCLFHHPWGLLNIYYFVFLLKGMNMPMTIIDGVVTAKRKKKVSQSSEETWSCWYSYVGDKL